jgi:hypothetical protein
MSRIDEMIYWLEAAQKQFQRGIGSTEQEIMGKKRFCCVICGHCPEAEAELLKEIRAELSAASPPQSKPRKERG